MSSGWLRSSNSRTLAILFMAVVAPPAVTLVWLCLQLLQQDRSLWAQRDLEHRQTVAQTLVHSLEQSLTEVEGWLQEGPVPEGAVRLTASAQGIRAEPAGR